MTRRQKRLLGVGLGAAGVLVAITAAVVMNERLRAVPADEGIEDVLVRELPADVPAVGFADATAAAGIRFRHFNGTRTHRLPEDMGSGLAWGDCDDDGLPDLYLVNFAGPLGTTPEEAAALPGNALYRNRGDGTFADITAESGAGLHHFGMGATWADYDDDGDLDLYVTAYGPNVLLRNDGACRFTDVTAAAGVAGATDEFSAGAAWGDYDGDGDLDLYVTNYVRFDESLSGTTSLQFGEAVPFTLNPASYEPALNRLYRNDGGRFVDVAAELGVTDPTGRSLSASWCDFDLDGDLDLYVANDISDNAMYRNDGGVFTDVSAPSLTADYRGAMGLAVADADGDGDADFFVTHWIAQENALYFNHREVNPADLFFADVAEMMGLGYTGLEYVGWATGFIDYDNDGRRDLFVVNGHTFEDPADTTRLLPQRMQLFWNRGPDGFYDASPVAGPPFQRLLVGRGGAAADYDRDGRIDLAVLEHGGPALLLHNEGDPGVHWIEIDLRQAPPNRFAHGAVIELVAGGVRQTHFVGAAASYLSQHDRVAHFGLGSRTRVERVSVRWPDGTREVWEDLPADGVRRLQRGTGRSVASEER